MREKYISYREYRRRVFNEALLECLCSFHYLTLCESCEDGDEDCKRACKSVRNGNFDAKMASDMAHAFFSSELSLDKCTIGETKKRLKGCNGFIDDVIDISEAIACDKAECAEAEEVKMPDGLEVELSAEDQDVIDKLFDEKKPELELSAVRDAMVKALVAEDQKATQIKDAVDMAKASAASTDGGSKAIEETINRISALGPTSLMNAIMTRVSSEAVKEVIQESGAKSTGTIMAENRDEIKKRSLMILSLYESANALGIHKYTSAEVKKLAYDIYYNK